MTRDWWLFARARRTQSAIVIVIALGLVQRVLGAASVKLSHDNSLSVPWAVLVPIVAAAVVGTTSQSAVGQFELATVRSLPALRASHLLAMLLIATASTALGSVALAGDISAPAAIRNLLGFTGLALLSAASLGGNLAWAAPVAAGLTTLTVGASQGRPNNWAWPIHTNNDSTALLIAVALCAVGATAVIASGTRERTTENS
jgi:hypothetical protein